MKKREGDTFYEKETKGVSKLYQGRFLNSVEGEYHLEKKELPEGTLFIATAHPLANAAAHLLEPASDD